MNLALTRPQSLQELYKTYFAFANKFQFTALLRNYIQNEEWKDKSQEKVWTLISRISDDLGAVLTDDIVNYTRNVVDVNTCKVPQFLEQCKMLSYNLEHIKNSYGFFPKRVQCLVDLFSVNPEYLIGNSSNHILSDKVIKEILVYIKGNATATVAFTNQDVVDRLIDDPHGLVDGKNYYNFVVSLFYTTLVEALSAKYSDEDGQPIVFNLLWEEIQNKGVILENLKGYKSWVDRYISNEIEHPLNDSGLNNTIWNTVQAVKNQKKMSPRFNPFKLADEIYFNGLNPNNKLTQDELDLIGTVLDYHARTKYNYQEQQFSEDQSTQFAYYHELEFCEYVKMVMFVVNNLNSFDLANLSYDIPTNKFIQYGTGSDNCLKVAQIFSDGEGHLVQMPNGDVALNHKDVVLRVAKFLADYVFHIQHLRENAKTIACKHAMRGTAGLLAHVVNDYLVKELPSVRDNLLQGSDVDIRFQWEIQPDKFLNYGNVKVLEYMDDNEYFNIDPVEDVRFTERTNARYWEKLSEIGYDESLGVLTKREIHDLYANVLGIGKLQPDRESSFDDVQDFLVDLFRIGANPVKWDFSDGDFMNPIDYDPLRDAVYDVEGRYGYTKAERMKVQVNTGLRKNQEKQFLEYSGQNLEDDAIQGIYDYMNNQLFYWKNTDYSSHVLHPFMYNLKLWNRLDNIIVNGYRDYINNDLVKYMSSKAKFDELVGEFGECRNFWKYNVVDMTGYTTRYEAAVKDEHKDDANKTTSQLTGYDGLFYPDAALEFLQIYADEQSTAAGERFQIPSWFFVNPQDLLDSQKTELLDYFKSHAFIRAIHSIYWQLSSGVPKFSEYEVSRFYLDWYSHLNYTRAEYQKIAMQLWYWRDRVKELIQTEYPIRKYCLDIQGNSLILVSTFKQEEFDSNRFLIDLSIAQSKVQTEANGNMNIHVPFCEDNLVKPSEMWVRWKSNPIAFPAFDIEWNQKTEDQQFDLNFRKDNNVEMGQLTHANNDCNDDFHVVIEDWLAKYGGKIQWGRGGSNRLPVFFDMEQSANVLVLASWHTFQRKVDGVVELDELGNPIYETLCGKNPLHIVSIERSSTSVLEYNWTKYIQSSDDIFDEEYLAQMLFDAYHYCPANGNLLIPLYNFDCSDSEEVPEEKHVQKVALDMWFIPAQTLKDDKFVAQKRIFKESKVIDLNQMFDIGKYSRRILFDHPVKVCRNTNLVFSPYEDGNGMNKVKCAFLGVYMDKTPDMDKDNHNIKSVSFNTGNGATRYEHDSQSPLDLGLVKSEYYRQNDIVDIYDGVDPDYWPDGEFRKRRYIDQRISRECFNSYDSNDKYVFVLDFQQSVDNEVLFNNSSDTPMAYAYNILSDAGYIPHFAYQSLVKYGDGVDGTAYTWKSKYLDGKEHLQFELLGLDDKEIPDAYANMERMVVEDTTDDCKTIVNPAKLMEDIYRVWCETKGVKRKLLPGEEDKYGYKAKYESYFENEYKGYDNPELEFDEGNEVVWDGTEDFELTLPQLNDPYAYDDPNVFKRLLDEYYITVVRTDKGELANERKYILPPTSMSEMLFNNDASTNDGYVRCGGLVEYADPMVQDNHYVPEQVVFTGTQNPFAYDKEGNRIYSKVELLQYGNGIRGVDDIYVGFDIRTEDGEEPVRDKQGNIVSSEEVVDGKIVVNVQTRPVQHKFIRPIVKFRKYLRPLDSKNPSLVDRLHNEQNTIPAGSIRVILSHRNMDNLAKYHILNTSSNLYFNGSLPKNGLNQFKHSDFKSDTTLHIEWNPSIGKWQSTEKNETTVEPILQFSQGNINPDEPLELPKVPPYYVKVKNSLGEVEKWYLEQDAMQSVEDKQFTPGEQEPLDSSSTELGYQENGPSYPIPTIGNFKWAHLAKEVPLSYLDYLYIKRGRLSFKVSEESESFTDLMSRLPSFHIDDVLKNKMADLNDVQVLKDYSTFVHQSENPEVVRACGSFNPLLVNQIVRPGVKQMEIHRYLLKENQSPNGIFQLDENGRPIEIGSDGEPLRYDDDGNVLNLLPIEVICANEGGEPNTMIELSAGSTAIPLMLQFEDGELDDYLKIYTNYVRVQDKHGDFHYDLYFNIQNLFNSPFEYISTVTKQPNVLVIPDSYLYLTGDKYTDKGDYNEVDDAKMKVIKDGGELSIYGQVKTYSDGVLSDAKTIKMFTYRIYNISDDKPKFLIQKTFDITRSSLRNKTERKVEVKFSDVLWTIDENKFEFVDSSLKDDFRILNQDVVVVQPIHINCHWDKDDDNRVRTISFDIMHDTIDFANVPELGQYWMQARTLNCEVMQAEDVGDKVFKKPYYDHWSDSNMKLAVDENTGIPRLTLTFNEDADFNFETIYLKWILPKGCRIMDSIDRMGGYVFSSTPMNIVADCGNAAVVPKIETSIGHIVARVKRPDRMYLGLEHSSTQRMNGYVISNLAEEIHAALLRGERNPTLEGTSEESRLIENG